MKIRSLHLVCFFALCLQVFYQDVQGDINLHIPRGSNNRLDGENANRENANRVFDSQNNDKGGYNVGEKQQRKTNDWFEMQYFMSSKKKTYWRIEWTNQHGCADGDLNCNIVIQYKCQKATETIEANTMRNGISENTPRYTKLYFKDLEQKNNARDNQARGKYVLNEPWEWYDKCSKRDRNKGLFTADQQLNGDASINTRQNPKGTRYGYECPEERDYFPYWHPTEWIDIAVLANKKLDCPYYKRESFNTKAKEECIEKYADNNKAWHATDNAWRHSKYNTKETCHDNGGRWVTFSNYMETIEGIKSRKECFRAIRKLRQLAKKFIPWKWGIPHSSENIDKLQGDKPNESWYKCLVRPPRIDCRQARHSRSNHLGNGKRAVPLSYNWKIPYFPSGQEQRCILRIRYNISTNDYDPKNTFAKSNNNNNVIEGNPDVKIGKVNNNKVPLQLAINTAQFGRTFQDRSHIFKIIPRPDAFKDKTIHNVNVRGKRGNIVQVYPAVEYDFSPKRLKIKKDTDLVHIQWGGSNRNPRGNAGQGRDQTDRSNFVEMLRPDISYPHEDTDGFNASLGVKQIFDDDNVVVYAVDANTITIANAQTDLATAGYFQRAADVPSPFAVKGCNAQGAEELDCYPPSYPGLLFLFKKRGIYYFMCSRNNNFTNRSQKGRFIVT